MRALVRSDAQLLPSDSGASRRTLLLTRQSLPARSMIAVMVALLVLLKLALLLEGWLAFRRAADSAKWSVCTMQPPVFEWRPQRTYACFISHFKREAASDARYLHDALRKMLKAPVYLDSSSLFDLRTLFTEGVGKSDCVLLLATPGVLTRPW